MSRNDPRNNPEAKRLRILRRAMGYGYYGGGTAFAAFMDWNQSELSLWERGHRSIARNKAITAHRKIPGLDPLYLTEGSKHSMSLPLRKAIEEAEKAEDAADQENLPGEGQDVRSRRSDLLNG